MAKFPVQSNGIIFASLVHFSDEQLATFSAKKPQEVDLHMTHQGYAKISVYDNLSATRHIEDILNDLLLALQSTLNIDQKCRVGLFQEYGHTFNISFTDIKGTHQIAKFKLTDADFNQKFKENRGINAYDHDSETFIIEGFDPNNVLQYGGLNGLSHNYPFEHTMTSFFDISPEKLEILKTYFNDDLFDWGVNTPKIIKGDNNQIAVAGCFTSHATIDIDDWEEKGASLDDYPYLQDDVNLELMELLYQLNESDQEISMVLVAFKHNDIYVELQKMIGHRIELVA